MSIKGQDKKQGECLIMKCTKDNIFNCNVMCRWLLGAFSA